MSRERAEQAQREVAAMAAREGKPGKMLDACGRCRHLHVAENGRLRELTTAERFEWELHAGKMLEASRAGPIPAGSLVVQGENK